MATAFVKILENRTKITKLSMSPFFITVTKWAWRSNSTFTGKVHLLPKWVWFPLFLPKKKADGLHGRFSMKARYGCDPSTQDNQSLPQSPLCLPLSHRSLGLRYSLFSLSFKQTPPLSQTCSQHCGWWITIHSWVINEAYCIHISSVIPIHSQDFPCK